MSKMEIKVHELRQKRKDLFAAYYKGEMILKNISRGHDAVGLSWSDVFYFIKSRQVLKEGIITLLKQELEKIKEDQFNVEQEFNKLDSLL